MERLTCLESHYRANVWGACSASRWLRSIAVIVLVILTVSNTACAEDELEVTVSGSSVDRHSSRDAAAASSVLRRRDLESPGADAAYELARVPGVQVQRSGGGSDLATASIRGTTGAQTPVYLAGIRLNDDLSGTADLSTIPLWMLDRVEIYRGHAPIGLESVGIGGAILFEPRLPNKAEMRGGFTLGSWGSRSVYGAAGHGESRGGALLALRREASDNDYGYRDNAGTAYTTADDRWLTRRNAQESTTDAWAIGRVSLQKATEWLLVSNAFQRSQGITGLLAIPAERAHGRISRELLGLSSRSTIRCGLDSPCQLTMATSFQRAAVGFEDPDYELTLGSFRLDSRSHRVSERVALDLPLTPSVRIRTILVGSAESLAVAIPAERTLDATRHSGSGELGAEWTALTSLRLIGSARFESDRTGAVARSRDDSRTSGRVGVAFEPAAGLTLMANGGVYSRVPTLGELYGTSAAVVGNSALQDERGFNRDLGVRYGARSASAAFGTEAFAFQQDIDGLVSWQPTFRQIKPYNVGTARLRGLETSANLELWSRVGVEGSATMLDPRDVTPTRTLTNDILPYRSRLVIDARIDLHTKRDFEAIGISRASLFLKGAHRGSRYQDKAGLIIIPHSTTFDAGMSVTLADAPVTVRVNVYNIFNISAFDIVGYPLPPRTVVVGAELVGGRP